MVLAAANRKAGRKPRRQSYRSWQVRAAWARSTGAARKTSTLFRTLASILCTGVSIACLAPSGAGKTTLLNLLGVMDVPTTGTLIVSGRTIAEAGQVRLSEGARDRLRREKYRLYLY